MPTGSTELDAQLPGGGWPMGAAVEVLQTQSGQSEWRLLLPALIGVSRVYAAAQTPKALVLVGAPHVPFGPALAGHGFNPQRLLCINTETPAGRMWAAEQALRCKDVAAVLAWLPLARADQLRRLQMAAAEHAKLLFVMRPVTAQSESSPAVLRLIASPATQGDALQVTILKRRGPPLAQALILVARPVQLSALLAVKRNDGEREAEREGEKEGGAEADAMPKAELFEFPSRPRASRLALGPVAARA